MMEIADFTGQVWKPKEIKEIKSVEEIKRILHECNSLQQTVTVRGAGHSMNQSSITGDIVLLNKLEKQISLENNVLQVSSSCSVGECEDYCQSKNNHFLCLQDKSIFSVGGTCTVGGIGWDSIRYGTQCDHIMSLEIITPGGESKTCNPTQNADLFRYSLFGLGQLGFIAKIQYHTVPLKKWVKMKVLTFGTFAELFEIMKVVVANASQVDIFHAGVDFDRETPAGLCWVGTRAASVEEFKLWGEFLKPFSSLVVEDKETDQWVGYPFEIEKMKPYQLWADYSFPNIESVKSFLLTKRGLDFWDKPIKSMPHAQLANHMGYFSFYIIKNNGHNFPLSFIHPNSEFTFTVGTYHSYTDNAATGLVQQELQVNANIMVELGGRPYLYGYVPLSYEQAKIIYGNFYDEWKQLQQKYDPNSIWIASAFSAMLKTPKPLN